MGSTRSFAGRSVRRCATSIAAASFLLAALADAAESQTGWVVAGRVVDAQSGAGVPNAQVTLDGRGSVLSSSRGLFRFERIPSAAHVLRVRALGFRDFATSIEVRADTLLVVVLEMLPIALDSVGVTLRKLDFDGRVRDPLTESWIPDARVRSDQGHRETSNLFGRFDLDDVFDGPPLRLGIQAFRYMPLDTTFIPDDEERYPFDLAPDPVMTTMIDRYVTRLDDRAGKYIYEYQPALNRTDLATFSPNVTLRDVIERMYSPYVFRSILCFFIDEQEYRFLSDDYRISVLEGTFTNDLERIEILELPGEGRLFMVRAYTRLFFQTHVGVPHDLATPSVTVTPGGVFCR
jgi:hypothetical protein